MSGFRWRRRGIPWIPLFFVFLPLLQAGTAPSLGGPVRFDRYALEEGLSHSSVTAIVQDGDGFLWFGTRDGLDRFDGYEFRIFRNDPEHPETLSHDVITALFNDSRGRMWIGTEAGLNRYDPATGSFSRYLSGRDSPSGPGGNTVTALAEDRRGRLWIGTPRGLIAFDPAAGRFTIHLKRPGDPRSLTDNRITSLLLDGNGALWVGTLGGLNRMDAMSGICLRVNHRDDDPDSLVSDRILAIHEDRTGRMWIGTDACLDLMLSRPTSEKPAVFAHVRPAEGTPAGDGRYAVRDIRDGSRGELWIATAGGGLCRMTWSGTGSPLPRMEHFRHDPRDGASLSRDAVLCLALDRTGMLWAGTDGGGVNKIRPVKTGFFVYRSDPSSAGPDDPSRRRVTSVYEDITGVLWLGTGRGILQPADVSVSPALCRVPARLPPELATARIGAVTGESGGDLWIATRGQGLFQWQPHTGFLVRYRANPLDPAAAGDDDLTALHIDRRRDVWVGTARNGVFRLPRTEVGEPGARKVRYRSAAGDPESLSNDSVTVIAEDREGRTWIGTTSGLNALRTGPAGARHLFDRFLAGVEVQAVHDDGAGHLWIGTKGRGLLRFDKREAAIAPFPEALGFPQAAVMGLLGDDDGRLWVSTNEGLACFDPGPETFRHYFKSDGLPSAEFMPGAAVRGKNGRLYFGSREGVASVVPGELVPNPHAPAIVLTGIFRSGRPAPPNELRGPEGPAERTIGMKAGEDLTLAFAALDYIDPSRNEFAYKLEPVHSEWVWLGTERKLSFAELKPGRYKLSVKGTNGDGIWNPEGMSLRLRVHARSWRSFLFGLAVVLAGGGAVLIHLRARRRRRAAAPDVSTSGTAGRR